jgi:hypothetical protein
MRKFALVLLVIGGVLAGCVAYEVTPRSGYYGDRDRDGDGVPNRHDRRPDDPRRY